MYKKTYRRFYENENIVLQLIANNFQEKEFISNQLTQANTVKKCIDLQHYLSRLITMGLVSNNKMTAFDREFFKEFSAQKAPKYKYGLTHKGLSFSKTLKFYENYIKDFEISDKCVNILSIFDLLKTEISTSAMLSAYNTYVDEVKSERSGSIHMNNLLKLLENKNILTRRLIKGNSFHYTITQYGRELYQAMDRISNELNGEGEARLEITYINTPHKTKLMFPLWV